jgi:Serine/Threonine/Tyrosine Kinase found in polyvalent proteins
MKHELQAIITGKSKVSQGAIIQSIAGYLAGSPLAGTVAEKTKQYKAQETEILKKYITNTNLWVQQIPLENYISEGAEQKVYLKNGTSVFKLNDSIYFTCWQDYFYNLLLHNYFFPDTAYTFEGFYSDNNTLFAWVSQPFVRATEKTDLKIVKAFMENNGFMNTRNHDYFNATLGVIIEDLHDENVITENGILRFIDTVFYIDKNIFFKE